MKRASYRAAIEWIAGNDDNEWLKDGEDAIESVTLAMVADLFEVQTEKATADLRRAVKRINA